MVSLLRDHKRDLHNFEMSAIFKLKIILGCVHTFGFPSELFFCYRNQHRQTSASSLNINNKGFELENQEYNSLRFNYSKCCGSLTIFRGSRGSTHPQICNPPRLKKILFFFNFIIVCHFFQVLMRM